MGNAQWLWPLELPPGVDARLDWIAGVVQLDATNEEYDQSFDLEKELIEHTDRGTVRLAVPPAKARVLSAYLHESLHFCQAVTTGYVYRWAVEHVVNVVRGWMELVGDRGNEGFVKQEVFGGRLKATAAARTLVRGHAHALDRPGASGLTVRSLIESHAYYVQMRIHFDFPSETLVKALNAAPDLEYRVAYDMARFVIGDQLAFDTFSLFCNAALCTTDPVHAFERLVFSGQRLPDFRKEMADGAFLSVWGALKDELRDIWIGTAPQVRAVNPQVAHPSFTPTIDHLLVHDDPRESRLLIGWFADPRSHLEQLMSKFVRIPVMLRSGDDGDFPIFFSRGQHEVSGHADVVGSGLYLAALASQIFGESIDWERQASRSPLIPLRWLTREDHSALGLEISEEALAEKDTSRLEELLTPVEGRFVEREAVALESGESLASIVASEHKSPLALSWHEMFLGRFVLMFPEEADTARSKARNEFVAKLAERVPLIPAYLYFGSDRAGFTEWFGSLLHPDDQDYVLKIAEAVVAIGTMAKQEGINAWLQARSMVDVFPREYAELLLQHPLFARRDQC